MDFAEHNDRVAAAAQHLHNDLVDILKQSRNVAPEKKGTFSQETNQNIPDVISSISSQLTSLSFDQEAEALSTVLDKTTSSPSYNGLGITKSSIPTQEQHNEILFQTKAWLQSITSKSLAPNFLTTSSTPIPGRHPMTLAQKILLQHLLPTQTSPAPASGLHVGSVIRAGLDWVIASELSWEAMSRTHEELGSPGIWRNDRLWIAGDHVVHPTITHVPKIQAYVAAAEKAKVQFGMTEYQGMNYTIMHTEFVRERAQPGQLVIGSDSHTCSAGAVGSLSIGLGVADVMMGACLGETWFKVPQSVRVEFVGEPGFGISGKDVILHILKELKRNTVAAERIVEFDGEGMKHFSIDARFAIANMCTEFGAVTGIFVPDDITKKYIDRRKRKTYRSDSLYFKADEGAQYAGSYKIDLSKVEHSIAVYPNPDDVVPVSEKQGLKLDGVFIGACTTTEEELVLGALILKAGLKKGLSLAKGKRHYVAGSLPIVETLKRLGLLDVYEQAGFTRGPPGCSLCVGLSAEKAEAGETWLSSQNRNFKNRMGAGSFGHLSSAVVCAASSFSMSITSPHDLLEDLDRDFWLKYKNGENVSPATTTLSYVEPQPQPVREIRLDTKESTKDVDPSDTSLTIKSKITLLGDFIDTDALSPGETLTTCKTDVEFGQHVLKHTHPDFRSIVSDKNRRVVVAGHAFGVGSSRESAVSALKGAGVQAVIARSFAFIYSRNQPSLGLLGIVMEDERFYEGAKEGGEIEIDVERRKVWVGEGSERREFGFELSEIEAGLLRSKGVAEGYRKFGARIWEILTQEGGDGEKGGEGAKRKVDGKGVDERLQW